MSLDPIVFTLPTPPPPPVKLQRPKFIPDSTKQTKIIASISAIVIALSMISFALFTALTNNQTFKQSHGIKTAVEEATPGASLSSDKSSAALPGGGVAVGTGGTSGGVNSPVVTLTAEPASVLLGGTTQIKWKVTNNPTSCLATEDWAGNKNVAGGSETTAPLTKAQTYIFTLTCKTATDTGYATVTVGVIEQSVNTSPTTKPTVTLAATPSGVYVGQSSILSWSVSNNPTSCTASGDWSGAKPTGGSADTGVLNTARQYNYTLTCSNGAGSNSSTTHVSAINIPPNTPIVGLSSNPSGPVAPGATATLTWTFLGGAPTSCTASGDWTGAKSTAGGSAVVGPMNTIRTYSYTLTCSNVSGSSFDTASILVIPNPPAISLTVSPSAIFVGSSATISWSATNSPTTCTASGDWAGAKAASGTASTGSLAVARTYLYSLSCANSGGTTTVSNIPLTVTLPPAPVVTINANPISTTVGSSSTLSWSATNSPTTCTASGDWAGAKAASGTASTGALTLAKTYTFTLTCSNAGGSGVGSTSVTVSVGGGAVIAPVVTITVSPASIGTGSSATISWSATNSPTTCTASGSWTGAKGTSGTTSTGVMNAAGTFTYTLTCSNTAGSDVKSAVLTVIAIPVVTISVAPTSIIAGASANISWSVTNTPTTCTAGGSWTGSKAAAGGPVTTGVMLTAGSFIYSLSCTNSGGTGSGSATLTVTSASPVFCTGLVPCYGISEMATRATVGNCWGWNDPANGTVPWVINVTNFRPSHLGGTSLGSLETVGSTCNKNMFAILAGTAAIPGYKDASGATTHAHVAATKNNTASSGLKSASFHVGYYDPTKP